MSPSPFERVIAAMREPGFYPHRPASVEQRETAISIVFLAAERVYKVKKPLTLPFLDYADAERRRDLCREEVRLNRRLAPDVYLGVRAIVDRRGDLMLNGDRDDAVEWAVEMRRLPEQRTMAALLDVGRLTTAGVSAAGRRLAAFHADAEVPAEPPGPGEVKRPIDENFQPLLDLDLPARERRRLAAAGRFFDAFAIGRRDLLAERAASGHVRDGHGDLRLEHVLLLDEGVIAYDAVEFDSALRRIDVAADLAFLVMELVARGADEPARELVEAYRGAGGEPGPDSLLAFYAAYRAWVRAKLAYLAGDDATALVNAAERLRWRARLPLIVVLCGVTASGKSTVARRLGQASGLPVLASDRVRKELAGVAPSDRAAQAHYGTAANRRTYHELGARATRGGGAIVDATFRHRADRDAFAEGAAAGTAPIRFVECRAPRSVLLERAHARERDPERVSDATTEMVDRQLADWVPLDEVPAAEHIGVRTDQHPEEILDELEARLDRRLTRG